MEQIKGLPIQTLYYTRTVQPVATCCQSPHVHKPAIVQLLLLIKF